MIRREFLAGILAACVAPAIVRASTLMPIKGFRETASGLLVPDDTDFLQSLIDAAVARTPVGQVPNVVIPRGDWFMNGQGRRLDGRGCRFILAEGVSLTNSGYHGH